MAKIDDTIITNALLEIGDEVVAQLQLALTEAAVMYDRTRSNLSRSNLIESMVFEVDKDGLRVVANEYWQSIEEGRAPQQRQPQVPFNAIYFWAKRYRIRPRSGTFSEMVRAIQRSIIIKGYRARPFVDTAQTRADLFINPYLDGWTAQVIDNVFSNFR